MLLYENLMFVKFESQTMFEDDSDKSCEMVSFY